MSQPQRPACQPSIAAPLSIVPVNRRELFPEQLALPAQSRCDVCHAPLTPGHKMAVCGPAARAFLRHLGVVSRHDPSFHYHAPYHAPTPSSSRIAVSSTRGANGFSSVREAPNAAAALSTSICPVLPPPDTAMIFG